MIIDIHLHYFGPEHPAYEDDGLEILQEECAKVGVDRVCISACGRQYKQPGNDAVRGALEQYPDLLIGFAYFRLGIDRPELVDEIKRQGFGGLKMISPLDDYDADAYMRVYEHAAKARLPILLHTGTVANLGMDHEFDVSSNRMRPILLDRIARTFPELNLIGAHLGGPWYDEAAGMMSIHPNVYFDLSGGPATHVGSSHFREHHTLFWWERLDKGRRLGKKIVFGCDGGYGSHAAVMDAYRQFCRTYELTAEDEEAILGGTAARLLGLSD